jgi:hypothetical protein
VSGIPEPVLGETCNFIRNQMRGGPVLEVTFLKKVLGSSGAFDMVHDP